MFFAIQAVADGMIAAGGGSIINMASIVGTQGVKGQLGYSATKGALEIITEAISMEVKPFGVNGGKPGECGKEWLETNDGKIVNLKGNDSCQVKENDLFIMETPGGGGFGSQ